jgi:hypothetical protein
VALLKLPGVESADVSLDKASADIRLKADNRITIAQLRETLKKSGYPTRDAHIEARGRVVDRGGTLVLDLLNGSTLEIEPKGATPRATDREVQITGVCRGNGKVPDRVLIESTR